MNIFRSTLVVFIMLLLAACTEDAVLSETEPIIEHAAGQHVMTAAELDALISETSNPDQMTIDEKMVFLSDHLSNIYLEAHESQNSNGRVEAAFIVCVAQVFNGQSNTYTTDVDTGYDTGTISANVREELSSPKSFLGVNANVYSNGINIDGKINNKVNFDCGNERIAAISRARFTGLGASTSAIIKCDD